MTGLAVVDIRSGIIGQAACVWSTLDILQMMVVVMVDEEGEEKVEEVDKGSHKRACGQLWTSASDIRASLRVTSEFSSRGAFLHIGPSHTDLDTHDRPASIWLRFHSLNGI